MRILPTKSNTIFERLTNEKHSQDIKLSTKMTSKYSPTVNLEYKKFESFCYPYKMWEIPIFPNYGNVQLIYLIIFAQWKILIYSPSWTVPDHTVARIVD